MAHPPGHNGVNVSWVTGTQRHQVGVQCPDSLQPQPDVTSRREVQEVRGQIIGSRAAINERCVDLRERDGERERWRVRQVRQTYRQTAYRWLEVESSEDLMVTADWQFVGPDG